jgi:hypothetical protein
MITTTAIFNGKYFEHFGIAPLTASLYGHDASEIVNVELIVHEDQSRNETNFQSMEPDYWGWLDTRRDEFTMIYPKYFLLNMCFPSGIKATEESG